MNINEYIKANRRSQHEGSLVKRLTCADGFSMSVQASQFAYALPRVDDADYYSHVEVGFPSEKPHCFAQYAEMSGYDDEESGSVLYTSYTETVYGYVPVELVEEEIARHGGIVTSAIVVFKE